MHLNDPDPAPAQQLSGCQRHRFAVWNSLSSRKPLEVFRLKRVTGATFCFYATCKELLKQQQLHHYNVKSFIKMTPDVARAYDVVPQVRQQI